MVKPILLYGCEALIKTTLPKPPKPSEDEQKTFFQNLKVNHPIISNFYDRDDPREKVCTKFCKSILGVHQKTSDLRVLGELGKYPMLIDQVIHRIKYFYHLEFNEDNALLQVFYENLKHGVKYNNIVTFAEHIHKLCKVNFAHSPRAVDKTVFRIRKYLQQEFRSYWLQSINSPFSRSNRSCGNKLRTYKKFKNTFEMEKYLYLPHVSQRKALSKLRISAHKLRIETGRYSSKNNYIKPEDRLCVHCDLNAVEDEIHFVTKCHKYNALREGLFNHLSNVKKYFPSYSDEQKFLYMMTMEGTDDLCKLAKFVVAAMSLRDAQ